MIMASFRYTISKKDNSVIGFNDGICCALTGNNKMQQVYNMNSIFFIAQSFYSIGVRIAAQPPPLAIVTLIESPFETITSSVLKSDA